MCTLDHAWVHNNCIRIKSARPSSHVWPTRGPSNGDSRAALDPLDVIASARADNIDGSPDLEVDDDQHAFNDLEADATLLDLGSEFADAYLEEFALFRQRENVRRARAQADAGMPDDTEVQVQRGRGSWVVWKGQRAQSFLYFAFSCEAPLAQPTTQLNCMLSL